MACFGCGRLVNCYLRSHHLYRKAADAPVDSITVDNCVGDIFCLVGVFMSMKKYGKWIAATFVLVVALGAFIVHKIASPYDQGAFVFDDPTQTYIKIHVLDVGQADAIIAELPGHRAMLIDAGTLDQFDKIMAHLEMLSIKKIDYVVGTHPHEDHVGSLHKILEAIPVGELYVPDVYNDYADKIYSVARDQDITIKTAKAGVMILDDGNLQVEILAPIRSEYEDINNHSVVIKITYVNNSFLFAGDATALSEKEMILYHADLDADVLKIAHHGAETSTTEEFLSAVSPEYAVISVGKNNSYGFPDAAVKKRLADAKVKVYRTDMDGTVTFFGNGQRVGVKTEE